MDKKFMRIMQNIERELGGIHNELKKMNKKEPLVAYADEEIEETAKRWKNEGKVVIKKSR